MVINDVSLAAMSLLVSASGASFASCQQVPLVEAAVLLRVLRGLRGFNSAFLCALCASSEWNERVVNFVFGVCVCLRESAAIWIR